MAEIGRSADRFCRVCGEEKLPKSNQVHKSTKTNIILKCTGQDVTQDEEWMPNFVCSYCQRKLHKHNAFKNKQKGGVDAVWKVPEFPRPENIAANILHQLKPLATKYSFIDNSTADCGVYIMLTRGMEEVTRSIKVQSDGLWTIKLKGKIVPRSNSGVRNIPSNLTKEYAEQLFNFVATALECSGNADFPDVQASMKNNNLLSHDHTKIVAYNHGQVIRSVDCSLLLIPGSEEFTKEMCRACSEFRHNLRARSSHLKRKSDDSFKSPNIPFSKLHTPDKKARVSSMGSQIKALQRKVSRLKSQIIKLIEDEAVETSEQQTAFLKEIVIQHQDHVYSTWPEGSPQRILWEEQVKRNNVKSATGMRWHPLMIKWAISLHCASPKAYRQIASSGFLQLPSVSTIKSYMNFTTPNPGLNTEVIEFLIKEANIENCQEYQRNVVLVWDEMKIKSGLVSSKLTGKIIGFCNLGEFNEELTNLSSALTMETPQQELASHILVFMVRGVMTKFNIPFMWFPCCGFMSEHLWSAVWKATSVLENLGLQVRAWVCDGATPNRKFFRIHRNVGGQFKDCTFFTVNRYDPSRNIYFICDPPHLLKTTRNNLENSHGHNNTKNLVYRGKSIRWTHISSTVREDKARLLNRLPKIREEHIHLSPQLRMRVRLAAQVLSKTMSNALLARNDPQFTETAHFCDKMDKWFDCLNGRFVDQEKRTLKPELAPYYKKDDWRFTWLEREFLGWLDDWEGDIARQEGLTKSERNALILSYQTVEGLRITTKSFIELVPQLLSDDGSLYLLPERLNQDALEALFGKLRRSLGNSDNPTVYEAMYRLLRLLLAGSVTVMPRNANCQAMEEEQGYQLKRK